MSLKVSRACTQRLTVHCMQYVNYLRGIMKSYLAEVSEMIQVLNDIHSVAVEDGHPLNKHLTAMHQVEQFLQNIYCDDH